MLLDVPAALANRLGGSGGTWFRCFLLWAALLTACESSAPRDAEVAPSRVLFFSERDGNAEIYVMNVDGTSPERLTFHSARDVDPDVSPDRRLIVFTSDRDGDADIYVMPITGGEPTNLTGNDAVEGWARWSPDGRRIAFHSDRDGNMEIYTMAADGSDIRRVTSYDGPDIFADWTPDGSELLFRRDSDLWIVKADGTEPRRLTTSEGGDQMAVASPHGGTIAAASRRDGYFALYLMNHDGGEQRNLTPLPAGVDGAGILNGWPAFSRDGRIFMTVAGPETGGDPEIFVMNADGSGRVRLTNAPGMDASPRPF
jgi:Tol biopolymer transport system component